MDRQLTIEPWGDNLHLLFHNYAGPFEGHQITQELGVKEVAAPADGKANGLKAGEGFLFHPMEYNPDLHAVISPDRLEQLVRLIDKHHITVRGGSEHLPKVEVKHEDPNYIEYIEHLHVPTWQRGPKAVVGSVLLRLIPAALIVGAIIIASRHYGDHFREVDVNQLFAQLEQPSVKQGAFERFVNPDRSHLLRLKVRSIRFMDRNRFVMADGNYMAVDGLSEVAPIFQTAGMRNAPPTFDIDVAEGQARVLELRLGTDIHARNLVLRRVAALGPSDPMPARGGNGADGKFQDVTSLPHDDQVTLENALGKKISLTGVLTMAGNDRVLRMRNGAKVVLESSQATAPMQTFLTVFTDDSTEITVDVELRTIYAWSDKKVPEHSRGDTKLIGEATLFSASAQNYHVVARR